MADAITTATTSKPKAAKETGIDLNGAFPCFGMPDAFRAATAQWVGHTKENLEKALAVTDEMNKASEKVWAAAANSAAEGAAKIMQAMQQNAVAGFDFAQEVMAVKSPAEALEISSTFARKQFDALSGQNRQLWSLGQQMAIGIARPMTDALPKAFQPTPTV